MRLPEIGLSVSPPSSPGSRGAEVRGLAARVNAAVVAGGESLDRALERTALDDPRDASLLRAIAYGAVRWHHRLQWQAEQLLSRPLKRADTELAALLRVGLFQLQWLRIPDHAAVAATVAAATLIGAARGKGLVNAVLRRFLRERAALEERMQSDRQALTSHPGWLLGLLERDWPAQAGEIVAANNQPPPMWLRVNIRQTSRADYLQQLAAAGIEAEAAVGSTSAVLLAQPQATANLPGFEQGLVSVQDGAAQRAAPLLEPQAGQRVLDACAAPGGKAAHLLEAFPGIAELVAVDRDPQRLAVVAENFSRLGLAGTTRVGDAAEPDGWWDGRPFERILLDAPCSALGVIRRHPDIKVLRRPADIAAVAKQQARLLRALWPLLAPGGRLLYATCTIARGENQVQIAQFMEAVADAEIEAAGPEIGWQILPGEANMDGFYYACLHKR